MSDLAHSFNNPTSDMPVLDGIPRNVLLAGLPDPCVGQIDQRIITLPVCDRMKGQAI